jgi:hypothetical protein
MMKSARASYSRWRATLLAGVLAATFTCNFEHPGPLDDAQGGPGEPSVGRGGAGGTPVPDPDIDGGNEHGGAGSTPAAGARSDAGTSGDAGAGGSTESCDDLTAELCMTLTWPSGIVPHTRDPAVPEEIWSWVKDAISLWEGAPVWDSSVAFVSSAAPVRPVLHFDLGAGCGVVRRSADALTFALSLCTDTVHIAREIGVALGLPRMHQRTDRDRYLDMAHRSRFDCTKGQFFDLCPREAVLGAFTSESLMFAQPASELPPILCALEPVGSYLYLPKNAELMPREVERCGSSFSSGSFPPPELDRAALAELYALDRGWTAFRPVGWEPATPWDSGTMLPMAVNYHPVAISEDGLLTVFVRDFEDGSLWKIEESGNDWGQWQNYSQAPGDGAWTMVPAPGSSAVDLYVLQLSEIHYARLEAGLPSEWVNLGAAPEFAVNLEAVREDDETTTLYVFGNGFYSTTGAVKSARTNGSSLSDWESLPGEMSISTVGDAVGRGARHYIVVPFNRGVAHISRSELGWSDWVTLVPALGVLTAAITVSSAGSLDIVAVSSDRHIWHLSCDSECSSANRWTPPVLIGAAPTPSGMVDAIALTSSDAGLDVVAMVDDERVGRGPWHKRWRPMTANGN